MLHVLLLLLLELSSSVSGLTVPRGSSFTLSCVSEDGPVVSNAEYYWSFKPKLSSDSPHTDLTQNETGSTLTLTKVGSEHEGVYMCVTKGEHGEDYVKMRTTYKLELEDPIFISWIRIEAQEAANVMLPCMSSPSYRPPAAAFWNRGMFEHMQKLQPKEFTVEGSHVTWAFSEPRDRDWSIMIANVTEDDSGMYECEIRWDSYKSTFLLELKVIPAPPPRCLNHKSPWEPCTTESRSSKAILQESLTEFSLRVYSHLRSRKQTGNLLFSPISIAGALSHLLLGARGKTRADLEDALSLPAPSSCVHSQMKTLREEIRKSLTTASHIYYSSEHRLGEAFINQSQEFYSAAPEKLTNDSEKNVKMINDWVAEKTNSKITHLVDSVAPDTQLLLLNAVYFNGKWKMKFDSKVKQGQFHTLSGDMIVVPVLYSSKYKVSIGYDPKLKAQVAMLPLTDKNSLFILVPSINSEKELVAMEQNMNFDSVKSMVKSMHEISPQSAEVTLPKIKLDQRTDIADLLEKMGLSELFYSPNLCALFPDDSAAPLILSDAQHRASLTLSETGVEAAAATSISFSRSYSSFSAMQPFVLLLWSDRADCPLFMGRVTDPR
ncbi:plasma protease C1 inhibitor [Chanos chanos]|uniref:Plasma protease C1 inhibitor n=1 Tax=Chanos chanos TaxID=29144 RepID=A0A6J2VGU7_CHACN|nr:plasma protease C1 inhibitor [Chanos chanos]XP_030631073.1 plasma protease C1 inhibitor [Chanos chanos]